MAWLRRLEDSMGSERFQIRVAEIEREIGPSLRFVQTRNRAIDE